MAIEEQTRFVKVDANEIQVGKPLAHPLYDANRRLLLKLGYVVENAHQCKELIERGLYRKLNERSALPSHSSSVTGDAPASRETITTLDATKIRIGDPLTMQKSSEDPRLVVKLIGYAKNKGLIVTVPSSDGEFIMLTDGQSFICRFFSGQNAYAFTTTVAKQTSIPFPHVHLSYPREVRGLEIRKGSRIDVEMIAAISWEGEGEAKSGSGKIVNISTGGGALRTKHPLGEKGDVISVKFKITVSDIQTFIVFDSIIRTIAQDQGDPSMPYLHGLQFLDPDPNMAMALAAFVYQKIGDEAR